MKKENSTLTKPVAETFAEYADAPDHYLTIKGVPPVLAVRLPGFMDFGIDGDILVEAVRKAGPENGPATPGWSDVLMQYGHQAMKYGEQAEKNSDFAQAERDFLEASFWYFFARFPHILNEDGAKAYQLHTAAYLRAVKHSAHPLEIIEINLEGKGGNAFLRFPNHTPSRFPVVMLAGGIDVWKSDLEIHSLSEEFLKNGLATLLIDVPGTGEAPIPGSPTAHSWFLAALDALKSHAKINASSIGFYGLSFGGYWATKLAFMVPWLAGAVNTGGPIHHTFQAEWLQQLPFGLKITLARMLNMDPLKNHDLMIKELSQFSLDTQGLLSAEKQVPLLNINGEDDEVVPIQEIHFLKEKGVKQDTLIFAHDRHVASRNWRVHEQFAAKWLAKKLT
jgi:esterase FrsA